MHLHAVAASRAIFGGMNAPARHQGIPLRADFDALARAAMSSLSRAAVAIALHEFNKQVPVSDALRRKEWDGDRLAGIVTRAATSPAMTSQAGWAAELAQVTAAFLRSLVPMSAGAALLEQGLQLDLDGVASITLPNIAAGSASWVGEGQPIRVPTMPTSAGARLSPSKLGSIVVLSRELLECASAEAIMTQALLDSTAPALDSWLFSNMAAVAGLHPAGLLVGVTPLTPSASTNKVDAMDDDLSALVGAIASYAGNGSVVFIASPAQATRMLMRAQRLPGPVLMSTALARTVICVASNSLAVAINGGPRIDIARAAEIHRDSSTPAEIVSSGGGIAQPIGEVFQTDTLALRMRWPVCWAVRAAGAVSTVSPTVW